MYRLSTGGWIPKESVQPLEEQVNIRNRVSGVSFEQAGSGEYYTFHGTANTMFRAYMDGEKLYVKLFNTTGIADYEDGMAQDSDLFDAVDVTEEDGDTVMQFLRSGSRRLWGYDISYDDGDVILYAKYAPRVSGGSQPLSGVTIAVDAGHGGADPGAIGIPGTGGAMEKDITLASAVAVQKRLESLGAKVVLCRTGDDDVDMNKRMQITLDNRARPLHLPSLQQPRLHQGYEHDRRNRGLLLRADLQEPRLNPLGERGGLYRAHQPGREAVQLPRDPQRLRAVGACGDGLCHQSHGV